MVNQRFTFAVHIMTALAFRGERMRSKSLASSVNTNPVVVRQLLVALRRARLVKTSAGRTGGAILARPAKNITLLDIYKAVDARPVLRVGDRKVWRQCPVSCNMKRLMITVAGSVEQAVNRELRDFSLDQLVRNIERKQR
jgi:Rrf2 family protein